MVRFEVITITFVSENEFELELSQSHLDHLLRALEEHRFWFPRSNVRFEYHCGGSYYETYVDNSSRMKLETLAENFHLEAGDNLRFVKVEQGTEWEITPHRRGRALDPIDPGESTRKHDFREMKTLPEEGILDMLEALAEHYDRVVERDFEVGTHLFPIVWKWSAKGAPTCIFDIFSPERGDAMLVAQKEARVQWNSRLVPIVTGLEDMQNLRHRLDLAFQEMRSDVTPVLSWDLWGLYDSKQKYNFVDSVLS